MITDSQIKQIRDNLHHTAKLNELLDKWEIENHAKALTKKGVFELALTNQKTGERVKVIATPIDDKDVFCFHKNAFGSGYTITHSKSQGSLAFGSLNNIRAAVKYLNDTVTFWDKMDCEENPLHQISDAEREIMRNAYDIASGRLNIYSAREAA